MAEETLVKEALTQEMVETGRQLIRALRDRKNEVRACFWLYSEQLNDWKLAVALPEVDTAGPRKAYDTIFSVTRPAFWVGQDRRSFDLLFQLFDHVVVLGPSNRQVRSVLSVPMDPNSLGMRFKRSRLGDNYFDDVYIYNLTRLDGSTAR